MRVILHLHMAKVPIMAYIMGIACALYCEKRSSFTGCSHIVGYTEKDTLQCSLSCEKNMGFCMALKTDGNQCEHCIGYSQDSGLDLEADSDSMVYSCSFSFTLQLEEILQGRSRQPDRCSLPDVFPNS